MENIEIEKKKKEQIVKITISKKAEEKLMAAIEKVNHEFEAGKVNRQDIASWALIRFAESCDAETINAIRHDHFDEFAVLEALLKRSKVKGQLPHELKAIARNQLNLFNGPRKTGKKALTPNNINDVIKEEPKQIDKE